jgi:hypothetical protein
VRRLARQGPIPATPDLAVAAGCAVEDLTDILQALGYRALAAESGVSFVARKGRQRLRATVPGHPGRRRAAALAPGKEQGEDHPFAKLRGLRLAR